MYDNTLAEFHPIYRENQWPHSYLIESLNGVQKTRRLAFCCLDYCVDALSALDVNGQVCDDFYLNALSTANVGLGHDVERIIISRSGPLGGSEVGVAVRVKLLPNSLV